MKANSETKQETFYIQELERLGPLPLSEAEIIHRVLGGEDLHIVNVNIARHNYQRLKSAFPYAKIYSAVKALSTKGLLEMLKDKNSCFEIATIEELKKLKQLDIPSQNILFSHPDRDVLETRTAFQSGLNFFISDSEEDLQCIAKKAPKSKILIRLSIPPPLPLKPENTYNRRFGVNITTAKKLLKLARKLNLRAEGLAFHIGTQVKNSQAWEEPIQKAGVLFKEMRKEDIFLSTLDLGGGFPIQYETAPDIFEYSKKIWKSLNENFKKAELPKIILEPGRGISGSSGLTVGRVIRVKTIGEKHSHFTVTLSTGRWNAGLIGVGYQINFYSHLKNGALYPLSKEKHVLGAIYGKSSSSMDRIHNIPEVLIPKNLKSGDIAVFSGTGAYINQMSSEFCGKKIPTNIVFDSLQPCSK